jgi:hypothetical protein
VLFRIMAEVQRPGRDPTNVKVEFPSLTALLRDLELSGQFKNRKALRRALSLWGDLSLRWEGCWYVPGPQGTAGFGKRGTTKELPPPITKLDYAGQPIIITLDPIWVRLAQPAAYYQPLPLPVPNEVAAQNLTLTALTSDRRAWGAETDLEIKQPRTRAGLAYKIATLRDTRKLEAAAAIAARWFKKHGGSFELWLGVKDSPTLPRKQAVFLVTPPKIPRWPRQRKRQQQGPHDEVGVAMARAVLSERKAWNESNPGLVRDFLQRMLKQASRAKHTMSAKQARWLGRLFYRYAGGEDKVLVERMKGRKKAVS